MGAATCCPHVLSPLDLTSGGTWVAAAHTPVCGSQASLWPPLSTALSFERTLGWNLWFASLPNTARVALYPGTRWYKGHKHLQQKATRKEQPRAAGTPAAGQACWVLVVERQARWAQGSAFLLLLCWFGSESLGS